MTGAAVVDVVVLLEQASVIQLAEGDVAKALDLHAGVRLNPVRGPAVLSC